MPASFFWSPAPNRIMVRPMKSILRTAILLIATCSMALAEENTELEVPEIDSAIPETVKALQAPEITPFSAGIQMAVSAHSEKAQQHVLQGLNHLHGGWEFEASRHFAAAMHEDPDCLLAHWGMVMSLLDASPEIKPNRRAAIVRMAALVKAGQGTELEQGYAKALLTYLGEGSNAGAAAFRKIADRFPNELQAAVFAALFSRGGYDINGSATPDQMESEKQLLALMLKFPESAIPINALLVIRAEAPSVSESLKLARKLCQMEPSYPPAFHTLGHYEWRNGNHSRAAAAFGKASMFYQKWMKQNKVSIADCPEWAKAECYRVVALLSMGDYETAYAAARQVAATPIPKDRPSSAGTRFLLWDGKTLPARILLHRGLDSDAAQASLTLPSKEEIEPYAQTSSAFWWIDGLRVALEGHRLAGEGKLDEARQLAAVLENHVNNLDSNREAAWVSGEGSQSLRAVRGLKVLLGDLRGRIALAGPKSMQGTAYNWYASAVDHQRHETMLYPPMILTPMAARMANYYMLAQQPLKAIESYQRALTTIPRDIHSLNGLRAAYLAAAKPTEAADIEAEIKTMQSEQP